MDLVDYTDRISINIYKHLWLTFSTKLLITMMLLIIFLLRWYNLVIITRLTCCIITYTQCVYYT